MVLFVPVIFQFGCKKMGHLKKCFICFRCNGLQRYYDEILKKKDDEQSNISLRAIDQIREIFSNFAKYGYIQDK